MFIVFQSNFIKKRALSEIAIIVICIPWRVLKKSPVLQHVRRDRTKGDPKPLALWEPIRMLGGRSDDDVALANIMGGASQHGGRSDDAALADIMRGSGSSQQPRDEILLI